MRRTALYSVSNRKQAAPAAPESTPAKETRLRLRQWLQRHRVALLAGLLSMLWFNRIL